MLLQTFLQSLLSGHQKSIRRRRAITKTSPLELLERRTMLTGNVQVQLTGADAVLTGDSASNSVEIVAVGSTVVVRGLDGTTINGAATPFTLSPLSTTFAGKLTAALGDGNDMLTVGTGITVSGQVQMRGEAGDDSIGVSGSTLSSSLMIHGGIGSNTISVQDSSVLRGLSVDSLGVAVVNISNSTIGDRLRIETGDGSDDIVLNSATINGHTVIETAKGDDDIVIRNSTLNGSLYVSAGKGNDVVFVDGSTVTGHASMWMRKGNDSIQVQGSSNFQRGLFHGALLGRDSFELVAPAVVSRVSRLGRASNQVDDALITARITDATTGAIAKAAAAATLFNPMLTVQVAADTVVENVVAPATTMTVTRTGSTAAALDVTLTSSNTARATVPATVTIPIGASSVTVNISAVDNSTADPDAIVTFTATATGFRAGTDTLTVTGEEAAALTITAAQPSIAEGAAAAARSFTVRRNTSDRSQSVSVALTSSLVGRLTVPATVTIPANQESVTFEATVVDNDVVDGSDQVIVTGTSSGFANGQATVTVTDNDVRALSVTATPNPVLETAGSGAISFTVSRNTADVSQALQVNLTSGSSRLTVPASVTIPIGSASAQFSGSLVDNSTFDGSTPIVVTAKADDFADGTRSVTVTDNEVAALTLEPRTPTAPVTISEGAVAPAVTFRVSRNSTDLSQALTVILSSGTIGRFTVPANVEIPATASFADFVGTPVNNTTVDGNVPVIVTASASGFTSDQSTVTINDNDVATISIVADPVTVSEGTVPSTVTFTVSRNTSDVTLAVNVALTSNTPLRFTVPLNVSIPAGQSSATFDGATVPNDLIDGDVPVTINASALGFASGSAVVTVNDNDLPTLSLSPSVNSVAENSSTPVSYELRRSGADLSQALEVHLDSAFDTRLSVPATVVIPAGAATYTFSGTPVDNLTVDGSSSVAVTATAIGFEVGQAIVSVTDNEVAGPSLSLSLSQLSVVESSGNNASLLTVSRLLADTSSELRVDLSLSDPGRLTSPAFVTIPAGQSSVTANLSTIDNLAVDGSLSVTIVASAAGFSNQSQVLNIVDNEAAVLELTVQSSTVAENSGTLSGSVSTSVISSEDIVVNLGYSHSNRVTGPATVTIPAGQSSVNVTFTIVDGSVFDENVTARIGAAAIGAALDVVTVTLTDVDSMSLTTNISANTAVASNGTVITRNAAFNITGVTTAGSTVTVDSDGDGQYDDATTTAGVDGSYSVNVTLLNNATNRGANQIVVKAVQGANSADKAVQAHLAVGKVVRFESNAGNWDVELLDTAAPITVANFLSYANSTAYDNLIVHRSVPGFVVQAGGFKVSGGQITPVATNAAIQNEFNAANSNLRGTLSMAQLSGNINSGTSQWFINTVNNSDLDAAGHTVFGRVIGTGMNVVDQITAIASRNVVSIYQSGALTNVPLRNPAPAGTQLTGTVSITNGSAVITGTGTLFTTELQVGSSIKVGGRTYFVQSIESNTSLTVKTTAPGTAALLTALKNVVPADADFVVFSNIGEILSGL